jgi:hypothetical protein
MPTPASHEEARSAVLDVVRVLGERPETNDDGLVSALVSLGHTPRDAERLIAFVPSAFAWALLKRMGVEHFPSVYIAMNAVGSEVELPLSEEHYSQRRSRSPSPPLRTDGRKKFPALRLRRSPVVAPK